MFHFISSFYLSFSLSGLCDQGVPGHGLPWGLLPFSLSFLSLIFLSLSKIFLFLVLINFLFSGNICSSGLVLPAYSALAMFLSLSSVLAEKSFSAPSHGDRCSCNTLSYVIVKQASAPVESWSGNPLLLYILLLEPSSLPSESRSRDSRAGRGGMSPKNSSLRDAGTFSRTREERSFLILAVGDMQSIPLREYVP